MLTEMSLRVVPAPAEPTQPWAATLMPQSLSGPMV